MFKIMAVQKLWLLPLLLSVSADACFGRIAHLVSKISAVPELKL